MVPTAPRTIVASPRDMNVLYKYYASLRTCGDVGGNWRTGARARANFRISVVRRECRGALVRRDVCPARRPATTSLPFRLRFVSVSRPSFISRTKRKIVVPVRLESTSCVRRRRNIIYRPSKERTYLGCFSRLLCLVVGYIFFKL